MNIRSFALTVIAISLVAHQLAIADGRIEYLGRDLEMNEIRSDTYAGTVIVLAFWATWCEPCRKELPWLEGIQRAYGKNRVTVIAINYDESRSTILKATSGKTWDDMQMVLAYDPRLRVRRSLGKVKAIPHTVVFNQLGEPVYQHTGYNEEAINALIKQINIQLEAHSRPELDGDET